MADENGHSVLYRVGRLERDLEKHADLHISVDAFRALQEDVREIVEGQRWFRRLLATQAIVTLGALVVLAISIFVSKGSP